MQQSQLHQESQKVQQFNPNPTIASFSIPDDKPPSPMSIAKPNQIIHLYRNDLEQEIQQLKQLENYSQADYTNGTYYGQMLNGKRHGKGLMIMDNRYVEGIWQNDRKHGLCREQFDNGDYFEGEYLNGKPSGQGIFKRENEIYKGQWVNGFRHGHGSWKLDRDQYEGEWKFGKIDGYGIYIHNRDKYQGSFRNNFKHGHGVETFANGDVYNGQYFNGKPEGQGTYIWANGTEYRGQFKNGVRHGQGVWMKWDQVKEGHYKYEGTFENDKKHGQGIFIWPSGNRYIGQFFNDYRHGYGEMYWKDQHYKGQWERGMQHGEGELYKNGVTKRGKFENNILMVNNHRSQSMWESQQGDTSFNLNNESFSVINQKVKYLPSIGRKPKFILKQNDKTLIVDNYISQEVPIEDDPDFLTYRTLEPIKLSKPKKDKRRIVSALLQENFKQ